jgi:hypothetical protein
MCFFSPLVLRIWLRSQAFAHMLRAPDLIPSTAQIELKELKTLVEELFFHFWAAFTIEASLCVVSATVVFKEFYSLRAGQVTICSTPSYPQILSPITASVQVSGWPLNASKSGQGKQNTEFCTRWGRTEGRPSCSSADLNTYRLCLTVHPPVGKRRLWNFYHSKCPDCGPSVSKSANTNHNAVPMGVVLLCF